MQLPEVNKRPAGVYKPSRAAVLVVIARPGQQDYYRRELDANNIGESPRVVSVIRRAGR
jgi:hypothetical protein